MGSAGLAEEDKKMSEDAKITVRVNGKCHPAIVSKFYGLTVVCNCPGSQNGRLAARCTKIADGHDMVNCRK